jgi:hypothetical protein
MEVAMIQSREIERNSRNTITKVFFSKKKISVYVVEPIGREGPENRASFLTLTDARRKAGILYAPPVKETRPEVSYRKSVNRKSK